jgi:cytochrome c peroxidase
MHKLVVIALLLLALACSKEKPFQPPALARFEPMRVTATNPVMREQVVLGKKLFHDVRLSSDQSTSCSGCHAPQYGFTIGAARPVGAYGIEQNRACPSLINAGYARGYYWENTPIPLEKAVLGMWTYVMVPKGDGRPSKEEVAARVGLTPDAVAAALASYIRTLVPTGAAWVRFHDGDANALSTNARRGYEAFEKARCANCHSGVLLADRLRHDIGTGGTYKTPTLLNIARSAPYFHDNRIPTLEEAVDRMLAGGFETKTPDPQLKAATLTGEEREQLLAFLRELNADPAPLD